MGFINITNTTIDELFEKESKIWVVDKLPRNHNPSYKVLTAYASDSDRNIDIIAKWLEDAGITPHREHNKKELQFKEMITYNKLVLIVCQADALKSFDYSFFHRISERFTNVIIQGDVLAMGIDMVKSGDFIQRALIGVHAQNFD